jgi:hypothetical protein
MKPLLVISSAALFFVVAMYLAEVFPVAEDSPLPPSPSPLVSSPQVDGPLSGDGGIYMPHLDAWPLTRQVVAELPSGDDVTEGNVHVFRTTDAIGQEMFAMEMVETTDEWSQPTKENFIYWHGLKLNYVLDLHRDDLEELLRDTHLNEHDSWAAFRQSGYLSLREFLGYPGPDDALRIWGQKGAEGRFSCWLVSRNLSAIFEDRLDLAMEYQMDADRHWIALHELDPMFGAEYGFAMLCAQEMAR